MSRQRSGENSLAVTPTPTGNHLVRGLGLLAATSILISDVIGNGVFLKVRVMTCNVGSPGMVITVWFVAGLFSLAGGLIYAELAAMMPRTGGEYVFIRRGRSATVFPSTENSLFLVCLVVFWEKNSILPKFMTPARPRFGDLKVSSSVVLVFWASRA